MIARIKYILVILLILLPVSAFSQGFDWQYSARMPSSNPRFFAGLSGSLEYLQHYGSVKFLEKLNVWPCCSFTTGNGLGTSIGLQGEYWKTGEVALLAGFRLDLDNGKFSAPGDDFQRTDNQPNEKTEWRMETDIKYLSFYGGLKYRLFLTHFTVGAAIEAGVLISSKRTIGEYALGGFQFAGNSDVRNNLEGSISGLSRFVLTPQLIFGYDLSLGLGMYIAPTISIKLPLMNLATTEELRTLGFSFGLTAFRGVK